jgi:serine protease AprX
MRRLELRPGARLLSVTLLAGAALALPTLASAKSSKLDPRLGAAAASLPADAEVRVIVFGDTKQLKDIAGKGKLKLKKRLRLIDADSAVVEAGDLESLTAEDGVDFVAPDLPVQPAAAGAPISFPLLSTLYPQIDGAASAWSNGYTGEGVGVAVIDSGVAPAADFGSRLTRVQLSGQPSIEDTYGHGTFVAGVLAGSSADGRYAGIAPKASIYAIDVNDASGVYTSNVIAGLDWVDANRQAANIRVVNVSLSETSPASYLSSSLDSAVERLWQHGVVVVVSAGNAGPGAMQYAPANDPFAIAVGAVDSHDTLASGDDTLATFSSYGTTSDGYVKPDVLAPGRRVPSVLPAGTLLAQQAPLTNILAPGYATMSGTSFAAPQVAGAAALLLQAHPTLTPDQVKWLLMQTGQPLAGATGSRLDIGSAIAFTGAVGAANQGVTPAPQAGTSSTTGTALTANTNSWNTNSWNTNSWNTNSWNTNSWNFSAWD